MLTFRHIKWGLISKLLMRAISWFPWIPGTLKLDSILSLFKCADQPANVCWRHLLTHYSLSHVLANEIFWSDEGESHWQGMAMGNFLSIISLPSSNSQTGTFFFNHCTLYLRNGAIGNVKKVPWDKNFWFPKLLKI